MFCVFTFSLTFFTHFFHSLFSLTFIAGHWHHFFTLQCPVATLQRGTGTLFHPSVPRHQLSTGHWTPFFTLLCPAINSQRGTGTTFSPSSAPPSTLNGALDTLFHPPVPRHASSTGHWHHFFTL